MCRLLGIFALLVILSACSNGSPSHPIEGAWEGKDSSWQVHVGDGNLYIIYAFDSLLQGQWKTFRCTTPEIIIKEDGTFRYKDAVIDIAGYFVSASEGHLSLVAAEWECRDMGQIGNLNAPRADVTISLDDDIKLKK